MNLLKLNVKVPKYDKETDVETWPEEWREEIVNLDGFERIYSADVYGEMMVAIILGSGDRIFVREPIWWIGQNLRAVIEFNGSGDDKPYSKAVDFDQYV